MTEEPTRESQIGNLPPQPDPTLTNTCRSRLTQRPFQTELCRPNARRGGAWLPPLWIGR
jgi:hypothetical protein